MAKEEDEEVEGILLHSEDVRLLCNVLRAAKIGMSAVALGQTFHLRHFFLKEDPKFLTIIANN